MAAGAVVVIVLAAATVIVLVAETVTVRLAVTEVVAVAEAVAGATVGLGLSVAVALAVVAVGACATVVAEAGAGEFVVSVGFAVGETNFDNAGGAVGAGLVRASQAASPRRHKQPTMSVHIMKGRADNIKACFLPMKKYKGSDGQGLAAI